MITLDKTCGMSHELLALLEVAAEEAGYDSPESFIVEAAVKEAGKVLAKSEAKADKHKQYCDEISEIGQDVQPEEYQLDLFGGDE